MAKGKRIGAVERTERLANDPSIRRQIFKELLSHLSEGLSQDAFPPMDPRTVKKYLTAYPEEFIQEEYDSALRRGRETWERIGHRQALGTCLGNSRTWFYNMSNRYGWRDKIDIEAEHKGQVNVSVITYARQPAPDTI